MPKDTFKNLAPEKQTRIDRILLTVFLDRHPSQVKVAEIVTAMGMSRGAFYKYFEDLADAYTYLIQKYMRIIHQDMFRYIYQNETDFFLGVEKYLIWCTQLEKDSEYWQSIRLLTQSKDWLRQQKRSMMPTHTESFYEWIKILKLNQFDIRSSQEGISFLYFMMNLVMDTLTEYIINNWSADRLLQEYRYKTRWLSEGLK